jgi:hypothetical protein
MDDISININVGNVSSICGKLTFTLVVKPDMQGVLQLYAYDPTDMRKSGTLIQLDANRYSELKQIINKIDATIEKLESSNQMTGLSINKY